LEALVVTVTSPVTNPAVLGRKVMLRTTLCPAATLAGNVSPVVLMPGTEVLIELTLIVVFPAFVSVTDCVND